MPGSFLLQSQPPYHEVYVVDVSHEHVSYLGHGMVPPDWFCTAEFNRAITIVYDFLFLVSFFLVHFPLGLYLTNVEPVCCNSKCLLNVVLSGVE